MIQMRDIKKKENKNVSQKKNERNNKTNETQKKSTQNVNMFV